MVTSGEIWSAVGKFFPGRGLYWARTQVLLFITEHAVDPFTEFTLRGLNIILGVTVLVHEGKEAIVGDIELKEQS